MTEPKSVGTSNTSKEATSAAGGASATPVTTAATPSSKPLNANAASFTFNAKVAEFVPKSVPPVDTSAAGTEGGNSALKTGYNPGAHEFVPNFMPPPMMGVAPNGQQVMLLWNPQMQQYMPAAPHQIPAHMQGGRGYMPGPAGYMPPFNGPAGNYNSPPPNSYGSPHMGGNAKQNRQQNNPPSQQPAQPAANVTTKPVTAPAPAPAPVEKLPEGNAIRFGTMPPARLEEPKPGSPVPAASATTLAASTVKPNTSASTTSAPAKPATPATTPTAAAPSQWGRNTSAALTADKDKDAPFVRGLVPGAEKSTTPKEANSGSAPSGWKRGESMSVANANAPSGADAHVRYEKTALIALYNKGMHTIPAELKALYGVISQLERMPLTAKVQSSSGSGGRGNQGSNNKRSGKHQEEPEVHPDEATIFDFTKKENAFSYVKDRLADDSDPDVICAKANLLLNKLSVTKFDKLSDDFMCVGLYSPELMARAVEMIVLKAQMEEHFCFMYADLCKKMTDIWTYDDSPEGRKAAAAAAAESSSVKDAATGAGSPRESKEDSLGKRFRACLLARCQEEFTVDRKEALVKIRATEGLSAEDKEEKEILLKKRYTGHMRFIGELYLKELVSANIMHRCISELLTATEEETLVCMCKLLVTIGNKLESHDKRKGLTHFERYFGVIGELSTTHPNSRMRFLLRDLIDQRAAGWSARREEEKAMDINDIRKGAAGANASSKSHGASSTSPRHASGSHGSDEWTTVNSDKLKKSTSSNILNGKANGNASAGKSGDARNAGSKSSPTHGANNTFSALAGRGSSNPPSPQGKFASSWSANKSANGNQNTSSTSSSSNRDHNSNKLADPSDDSERANLSSNNAEDEQKTDDDLQAVQESNAPGADGTVSTDIRQRVRSILSEYYMNEDPTEALLSLKDTIHPNAFGYVIGNPKGLLDLVFEKYPGNNKPFVQLVESLFHAGFLTSETLIQGVHAFLDNLDETVIDTPKAGEYSAQIFASLIHQDLLSLEVFNDQHLPSTNLFVGSFRRAAFLADILMHLLGHISGQGNSSNTAVEELVKKLKAAQLDVLSFVQPQGPKETPAQAVSEFLGKYNKLSFLQQIQF